MELQTAIEILEYHQEWRLGKREDMIHEPKKLTEALDIVLSEVKKIRLGAVIEMETLNKNIAMEFISINNYLPEHNKYVLVKTPFCKYPAAVAYWNGVDWIDTTDKCKIMNVEWWRPLNVA